MLTNSSEIWWENSVVEGFTNDKNMDDLVCVKILKGMDFQ